MLKLDLTGHLFAECIVYDGQLSVQTYSILDLRTSNFTFDAYFYFWTNQVMTRIIEYVNCSLWSIIHAGVEGWSKAALLFVPSRYSNLIFYLIGQNTHSVCSYCDCILIFFWEIDHRPSVLPFTFILITTNNRNRSLHKLTPNWLLQIASYTLILQIRNRILIVLGQFQHWNHFKTVLLLKCFVHFIFFLICSFKCNRTFIYILRFCSEHDVLINGYANGCKTIRWEINTTIFLHTGCGCDKF